MPPGQPASERQMTFLWNLVQGGHDMQLGQYMPPQLQTAESAMATFQAGMTSENASTWIEDLIFRVGAVPSGSRVDQMGNTKIASEKQVALYNTIAQELAAFGDQQWVQHQMQGRYSWTVSKWINKLMDLKGKMNPQPQQQWGQQPAQQSGQPQQPWQQQPAQAPVQQGYQPAPAQQPPYFDGQGNAIQQGAAGDLPFN